MMNALDSLIQTIDPDEKQHQWEAFTTAWCKYVEAALKILDSAAAGKAKERLKNDPVLQYVKEARNIDTHHPSMSSTEFTEGVEIGIKFNPGVTQVRLGKLQLSGGPGLITKVEADPFEGGSLFLAEGLKPVDIIDRNKRAPAPENMTVDDLANAALQFALEIPRR
ncbi:hypothetical protein QEZ48_10715 [Aquamicrobium lusatiense]|uniref:hypothetical protein n=1 Tax=Aquamicrobium lusatiense TaxID=89772 RepID=UPI002456BCC1|nr:hypothetical protein [Aquamicrobium lusatiense]MDH4991294.1 hypothetical protein [Aquamicrobium lusatiense]